MEDKKCKECAHFHQHYGFDKRKIFRVYCGHCTLHKAKRKKPDSAPCDGFVAAPLDECAFVTKEYLSKELVQYFIKLELLPRIYDDTERKIQ